MTEPLTANTMAEVSALLVKNGSRWEDRWWSVKTWDRVRRGIATYRRSLRRTRRHGARRGVWRRPTASRRSK